MEAKGLIESLGLEPHPEGGYFRETYRSGEAYQRVAGDESSIRNLTTVIYFLLTKERPSKFHRLKSDEIWFHHTGSPLEIHMLSKKEDGNGVYEKKLLGSNTILGEIPQFCVPAGVIFASSIPAKKTQQDNGYALVSCIVSPGFEFSDFEMLGKETLMQDFSHYSDIVQSLAS